MRLALITPSYAPDRNRCSLLSQSIDRWVDPSIDHIVIVPRRDEAAFNGLPSRSKIVTVESILPKFAYQAPMSKKWWLTLCSLPVRGWIMQQIVKLSCTLELDYDAVVFVDSDIVIVKPVAHELFVKDGRVRLHKVLNAGSTRMHARWHRSAARILGIEEKDYFGADYIAPLVTWDCCTTREMLERIDGVHKKHWFVTLCNTLHFSEYILYGIYTDSLTEAKSKHYEDNQNLCHCFWGDRLTSRKQLDEFVSDIEQEHIAILIQSNLGIEVGEYYDILKDKGLVN